MKKTMIGMAALVMLGGTVTFAGAATLEDQLRELMEQNKRLTERIIKLEQQVTKQGEEHVTLKERPATFAPIQKDKALTDRMQRLEEQVARQRGEQAGEEGEEETFLQAINDHVELSGVVEVEAASWSVDDNGFFEDDDGSDVSLATVEIGLDAQISEWSSAHILLLYEEGEEDDHVIVDEGTITLGNMDKFPLYLTAGKMYVPFGCFETNMISDPLTLEMGETNDSAVLLGFESGFFHGSLYAFNGDINESGDDDEIDTYGAVLGYIHANDNTSLHLTFHYISNIGDTDGIGDYLQDEVGIDEIDDYVDGVSVHAHFGIGPFTLVGEYLTALDDFEAAEIAFDGDGAEPESWNIEFGYTTEIFDRETTFALGYQGTDESVALGLPEELYIGAISMEIFDHTSLAFEYFHAEDYDKGDGGTDDDADVATMQLAVEF
ncbi:MAG: LbtU family siderophore porin [Thermodesulfobacteriota bacterium]|nr:LbtU family siderophore porin [Thermodesulfobacteriota bacterium]